MSFEEENEVSQHLPAAQLKELTFLTKRSSSSTRGPELERTLSIGGSHTHALMADVSQGLLWDGTAHRLDLLQSVCQRDEVVYQA